MPGIPGDPAAIEAAAEVLARAATRLAGVRDAVVAHGRSVGESWHGVASLAAMTAVEGAGSGALTVADASQSVVGPLRVFAVELRRAQQDWATGASIAQQGEALVVGAGSGAPADATRDQGRIAMADGLAIMSTAEDRARIAREAAARALREATAILSRVTPAPRPAPRPDGNVWDGLGKAAGDVEASSYDRREVAERAIHENIAASPEVRPEVNVDTYIVAVDGGLEPVSMCARCRALLPDVSDDGSSPVPIVDLEHLRAVMTALFTPVDYLPRVPPARFGHGDLEDPRTPGELRRLVDAVETERGNTAMVLTGRDPDLAPEAALDAMLADPPAALWPGTPREDGGGFRVWPDCAVCAELDEIDRATARVALGDAISLDLAYDSERIERARAGEFADAILAFVGPAARWWTNTRGGGTGWLPLTSATFDRGVLGVDQDCILADIVDVTSSRAVLRRDGTMPEGHHVHTAYPVPSRAVAGADPASPEWAQLVGLFSGYLHQDVGDDHGTVGDALVAFAQEWPHDDVTSATGQADRLLARFPREDDTRAAAEALGLEYHPPSAGQSYRAWLGDLQHVLWRAIP